MGRENTYFIQPGYSFTSFLSAAAEIDPYKIQLGYKHRIPISNWCISYNGLSRLNTLDPYIERFELVYVYRSSYTVRNIQNNIDYFQNPQRKDQKDRPFQFIHYGNVMLSSYFSPLLQINMTFKLNMTFKNQFQISDGQD
ncbi:hypothetical protein [Bacteroidetes bacterium endosymbiont of Geopemphigus sp.]|uniref:hypothetical protein n=1 Tax=Bacteroidetes bacterium endosymbiont of Geopemphigus sp. TaxID=2047937 RepID=UPI000CD02281|nr:hypothetical protein [Bacteroidetes bacterium endosymbiont of Geopemphigus sp.]